LENAGNTIRHLIRRPFWCFKEDAAELKAEWKSGGGEALWKELIANLRTEANLPLSHDLLASFDEDCGLVAEELERETRKNNKKHRRRVPSQKFTDQQAQAYNLVVLHSLTYREAAQQWQPEPCTWQNVQKHAKQAEAKAKNMRSKSVDDYLGATNKKKLPFKVVGQTRSED
jgi:hypothetical protein